MKERKILRINTLLQSCSIELLTALEHTLMQLTEGNSNSNGRKKAENNSTDPKYKK